MGYKVRWDGKVRPPVDTSSPRERDNIVLDWLWNPILPDTINSIMADDFLWLFSSIKKFLVELWRVGRGVLVSTK